MEMKSPVFLFSCLDVWSVSSAGKMESDVSVPSPPLPLKAEMTTSGLKSSEERYCINQINKNKQNSKKAL